MQKLCPCHSGNTYQKCCNPFHAGENAPTAEQLMRSRYSAYVLKLVDYLSSTWHPRTRPIDLTVDSLHGVKWVGLTVISAENLDHAHATVTFKATFKAGQQKNQTLHETSRFVCENGQWFYIDGDIHN
jgi:SEC-C motif-containing protein